MTQQTTSPSPICRIQPFHYIHVLDRNTGVTRLEIGPQNFFRQNNELISTGPDRMISLPPRHYCVVENPVVRNERGEVEYDQHGQVKLSHGNTDVRLDHDYSEPFPLYPGETLKQKITSLKYVAANHGLILKAYLDFQDDAEKRKAGDEWLFEGPGLYIPRREVSIQEEVQAEIIGPNQALRLSAKKDMVDRSGRKRFTGEQWLIKIPGAYLPMADEKVVRIENALVLTDKKALHLRAINKFVDDFENPRNAGDEWLITREQAETYILNVNEELVNTINMVVLNSRQYCVILNPMTDQGKNLWSRKKLVVGEKSFFLQPNEQLEKGIQDVYILDDDEALVVKCIETFDDESERTQRGPGDKWLILGPKEYVPPVQVEVLNRRKAIPSDEHEGIYVRDVKTGHVRTVIGQAYLLKPDEELWSKELSNSDERFLLQDQHSNRDASNKRQKWRLVTYRVPNYSAVQVYDYKLKQSRSIFGPELVMLGPDEDFTVINRTNSTVLSILVLVFLSILEQCQTIFNNRYRRWAFIGVILSYWIYRSFFR